MRTVQFVPGAIATPLAITLPTTAPDIDAVVSAEIERLPSALGVHPQADIVGALADHAQALIVGALADHAVHQHDITMVVPAGGGAAVTAPVIAGPIEQVGGPVTHPNAVDANAAAQAHAAGAATVGHLAGAATVPHAGADPVVAAVPTILTTRTFSLDVSTLVGDLVTLNYLEVGERVLVS